MTVILYELGKDNNKAILNSFILYQVENKDLLLRSIIYSHFLMRFIKKVVVIFNIFKIFLKCFR